MEPTIHGFVLRHARRETLWVILLATGGFASFMISVEQAAGSGEDGFTSHFATCPEAATHRRPR